jgi:two-component system nitrate/nitrite response regulator NarL
LGRSRDGKHLVMAGAPVVGCLSASPPTLRRVLIVDDAPDMRQLLRITLGLDASFEVVGEGADGRSAIELAERLQPAVVLLDHHMPGLTGLEALPEIRQRAPDSLVVVYTADTDPRVRQAALQAGAIAIIDKTTVTRELSSVLRAVVAARDPGANE